jgi:hypothetical protein
MYDAQGTLQRDTLGIPVNDLTQEDRVRYIKDMVLALTDELHEVLGEVGWKPWATSRHINEMAYRAELVDVWHFFMNLMLAVGMTPNELYEGYVAKRKINVDRQKSGYDGVSTKCFSCRRAYDDSAVSCHPPRVGVEDLGAYCARLDRYEHELPRPTETSGP